MRIISGKYKKRQFIGKIPSNVRPTQDALRETIFNILSNYIDFDDLVVADICAGTGALGIEALSRNAKYAFFVDISYNSLSYIKSNCIAFGIDNNQFSIVRCKAESFFDKYNSDKPINLIFTDPPYDQIIVNKILYSASISQHVVKNAFIVAEYSNATALQIPENFTLLAERHFTVSNFVLLQKNTD